ncbi:MAG: PD-(D/E)XK nuclease family protein, partial [Alistipes sp.]|nr:PD-(D/E)XK nuclease family protein [Alistipes sp.]
MSKTFQHEIAEQLYRKYGDDISSLHILFPSRRARLFFNDALASVATRPLWQPNWLTIDDLIEEITGLHKADKIRLITELYKIYAEYHPYETFDKFYFWGEMLLADFDMIDKYMIDADMLLRNIEQIKELETDVSYLTPEQMKIIAFWGSFGDETNLSEEKRKFLNIWRTLPVIYSRFRDRLQAMGMAYTGMAYRQAAEMISRGEAVTDPNRRYVVAGFNALSQSEKRLFRHIETNCRSIEFLWDYDSYYVDGKEHEAGMFLRENIAMFKPGLEISHDNFTSIPKEFSAIACASNAVQCKYVAEILSSLPREELDKRTAVVLTDENLLIPLLYSLPQHIEEVNVTMGYPLKLTLVYSFIERLIELQSHCRRKADDTIFYHADVTGILSHPYIAECCHRKATELYEHITRNRIISVRNSLFKDDAVLSKIFSAASGWHDLSQYILDIIDMLVPTVGNGDDKTAVEYMALAHEEIGKLSNSLLTCDIELSDQIYVSLLRRHLQEIRIPYEGEPLNGIQVMGILETRNVDFDNVIILSMTDATFPGDRTSQPSFIPYNLRAAYGLPTPEHHEGVYAYYFYRLIERASRVFMMYCSRADEKSTGEQSRYIYQLAYESPFDIRRISVGVDVNIDEQRPITIAKDAAIMERLERYLTPETAYKLSPTALFRYVQCPLKFYFASVARLKTSDEVSDEIDALTFGNILHEAMFELYKPLAGIEHPAERIELLRKGHAIEDAVDVAVGRVYLQTDKPQREDYTGNTLLVKDIVTKYIRRGVMRYDARNDNFAIVGLEQDVEYRFPLDECRSVTLAGRADRIDSLDGGALRIIDYKSGNTPHLDFNGIDSLFNGKAEERISNIFQTLLYSMILHRTQHRESVPTLFYAGKMHNDDYSPLIVDRSAGHSIER